MTTEDLTVWLKQRGVQRVLALAALIVLGASHYLLSRLPVPVALESLGPMEVSGPSELVIDQRLARPGLLLVFEGEVGDAVDVRFDRARLEARSARLLQGLGVALPTGDHPASLLTRQAEKTKTFLRIEVVPIAGQVSRVTLKSPREAGDAGLALSLHAEEAQLAVSVLSAGDLSPGAPPPQRTLRLAEKLLPVLSGAVPLAILSAVDSEIRLRVVPAARDWDDVARLALAPADHRDAALSAFGIGVRADRESVFTDYACATASRVPLATPGRLAEGRCAASEGKLQLVSLGFRPGVIHAQASGQAWVRKNGAVHILDLVGWLKKNPVLAALIAALDAAVLAWSKQVFFGGARGQVNPSRARQPANRASKLAQPFQPENKTCRTFS